MYLNGSTTGVGLDELMDAWVEGARPPLVRKGRQCPYATKMRLQRLPKDSSWDRKYAGSHRRWVRPLLSGRGLENQKDFWQAFQEKRPFRSKPPIQ